MARNNKVEYDETRNYNLKASDLEVVLTTKYGKIALVSFGNSEAVGIPSNWIQQDTEGKMSFGIADVKEYVVYKDEVKQEQKVKGEDLWAGLETSGYTAYKFPEQTEDEMIKALFTKSK